jgi:hypothetical protein
MYEHSVTTYRCGRGLDRPEATWTRQVQQAKWHLRLSRLRRGEPVSRTTAHGTVAVGTIIADRVQ